MSGKRKSRNLANGTIRLSSQLVVDDRLRVDGILYLEEKYDMTLQEVMEKIQTNQRTTDGVNIMVALAIQRGLNEEDIRKTIGKMSVEELTEAVAKMTKVFEVTTEKKSIRPTAMKKKSR